MLQQFIGFVFCGLAIVASDGDVQVGWQQVSAQRVDLLLRRLGNVGGVGALAFGQGDGHRRIFAAHGAVRRRAVGVENVIVRLGRAVSDRGGDIAQIYRMALVYANNNLLQVIRGAKEASRFDGELLVVAGKAALSPVASSL